MNIQEQVINDEDVSGLTLQFVELGNGRGELRIWTPRRLFINRVFDFGPGGERTGQGMTLVAAGQRRPAS